MTAPGSPQELGHDANPLADLPGSKQALNVNPSQNITTSTGSLALRAAMNDPSAVLRGDDVTVASSADSFSNLKGVQNPYGTGLSAYEPNTVLLDDYAKSYNAVENSKAQDAANAQADTITLPGVKGASSAGYAGGGVFAADGKVAAMVQAALTAAQKGIPYVWGGTNIASGVDCSGLVYAAAKAAGIQGVQRYRAQDLGKLGSAVSAQDARPGDIVFYDEGQGNGHVGIYLGNGMMVAAPQTGQNVQVQKVYGTPTSIRRIFNDSSYSATPQPSGSYTYQYNGMNFSPWSQAKTVGTITRTSVGSTRAN